MNATFGTDIDWAHAKSFLLTAVRSRWFKEESQVDEIVQACLVRLLRASRRGPIHNVDALMNEIAKRAVIDELRKRQRASAVFEPASEATMEQAQSFGDSPDHFGDPLARIQFVVLNFFGGTSCAGLAQAYFAELNWEQVAASMSSSHAAIRKQWSRCLTRLRDAVRTNPDISLLREWAEAGQ